MQWVLQPQQILNYKWLAILYGVMVVVAGALFAIETSDTFGKAVSSAVAGFWIIPAPAAAFLVHALAMIAVQRGQPLPDAADKKTR